MVSFQEFCITLTCSMLHMSFSQSISEMLYTAFVSSIYSVQGFPTNAIYVTVGVSNNYHWLTAIKCPVLKTSISSNANYTF